MSIHRLFFAIWPDDSVRAQMASAAADLTDCHGKRVPAESYHITLAFLGNVTEEQMACVFHLGDTLSGAPFELQLDQFGFFKKAHVVWLGPEICPAAAILLYGRLQAALPECGLMPEARPFHPHLTLIRKVTLTPEVIAPVSIRWPVKDFVLVESETGSDRSHYRVVRRWPLSEGEPDRG
jgi:2'-5' RNA ligase